MSNKYDIQLIYQRLYRTKDLIEDFGYYISKVGEDINIECKFKDGRLGFDLITRDFKSANQIADISIRKGEIIHNLASLIDNMVYFLAEQHKSPPDKPRSLHFPIYTSEDEFLKKTVKIKSQLDPSAYQIIQNLQPYNRNTPSETNNHKSDGLYLLKLLNNIDKHRYPLSIKVEPKNIDHERNIEFYSEEDALKNGEPNATIFVNKFTKDTLLMSYITKYPINNIKGKFNVSAELISNIDGVEFNTMKLLRNLFEYTYLVLCQF